MRRSPGKVSTELWNLRISSRGTVNRKSFDITKLELIMKLKCIRKLIRLNDILAMSIRMRTWL